MCQYLIKKNIYRERINKESLQLLIWKVNFHQLVNNLNQWFRIMPRYNNRLRLIVLILHFTAMIFLTSYNFSLSQKLASLFFRRFIVCVVKDGAYYCYCAYVLRISRDSDFLSPMLTNTGIFLHGLKLHRGKNIFN